MTSSGHMTSSVTSPIDSGPYRKVGERFADSNIMDLLQREHPEFQPEQEWGMVV